MEYIVIEDPQWCGEGVARAAIRTFIDRSRRHGERTVTTNNTTHPAAEHILETEGFDEREGGAKWVKKL